MIEVNNKIKVSISTKFIKNILEQAVKHLKIEYSNISVALVGESDMARLNRSYRGKNKPTDVLSFNYNSSRDSLDGEIIICYPILKKHAREQSHSVKKEISILLVHGLLHLAGYDHETDKESKQMKKLEQRLVKIIK